MFDGENEQEIQSGMDHAERTAAALEEWDKPADQPPEKPEAPADGAAAAGAAKEAAGDKPAEAGAAAEKPAEGAAPDITKAPFFNDPAFQAYHKTAEENKAVVDGFREMFDAGHYKIDSTENLKAVLEDSFTLYDIAAGKKNVSELMDLFEKNWDPGTFKQVLSDLVAYAGSKGIEVGAGGDGGKKPDDNPLAKEVAELRAKIEGGEKSAKQEAETKDRMENVVAPLMKKVAELCGARDIKDAEDVKEYNIAVADAIGRMKPEEVNRIASQIKAGKWGEVERVFTEYHNKMVARATRLANAKTDAALKSANEIPRQPAGGSTPAPPAKGKRDLKTSEGRTDAALAEWNAKK